MKCLVLPFSALTPLNGQQEGHPAYKTGCWIVGGNDLTGALHMCLITPAVITMCIILSSNKIQNKDNLVPANPGSAGRMAV